MYGHSFRITYYPPSLPSWVDLGIVIKERTYKDTGCTLILMIFLAYILCCLPFEINLFCAQECLIFWCFITSVFWFKEYCQWLFLNPNTVNDKTSDIVIEEGFDFHTPIFTTFQTVLHYVHRWIYQLIFTVAWHFISPYNSSSLSNKHEHDLL